MSRVLIAIGSAIYLAASVRASDAVTIKVIKYPELGQAVKQYKGHVIVVDFWADT
jgi:hypothetical protein